MYVLSFSGTPGGDTSTAIVHIDANAATDVALNPLVVVDASFPVVLVEHPDIVRPLLLDVELNYGIGNVIIRASETIDATVRRLRRGTWHSAMY